MKTIQLEIPHDRLKGLCRRWRIVELAVFGSVVRPDFRADSDIDVLVRFDPDAPWSLLELVELRDELQTLLGREVDLVEEEAIRNPYRRQAILRDKEVIYAA